MFLQSTLDCRVPEWRSVNKLAFSSCSSVSEKVCKLFARFTFIVFPIYTTHDITNVLIFLVLKLKFY